MRGAQITRTKQLRKMKFKTLKLFTNKLEAELEFYLETLGFELIAQNEKTFTVQTGWTALTFEKSEQAYTYHYCFLIPSNQLGAALRWMQERTEIVEVENGAKIQNFDFWNADSFYFYDASGNIAECIARHDLKNEEEGAFDISKILGVNEIGIPTKDIQKKNQQLEDGLKTKYWKGDLVRFGTNGSLEGIFLLPIYEVKKTWFPTSIEMKPQDFEAVIENEGLEYSVIFKDEQLKIAPKTRK